MCVLVRDSTSSSSVSQPNIYTLNFPVPTIADINNNSNIVTNPELTNIIKVEFRIVENLSQILSDEKGASRGPIDIIDPSFQDFSKFMKLRRNESSDDDNDEEEDDVEDTSS